MLAALTNAQIEGLILSLIIVLPVTIIFYALILRAASVTLFRLRVTFGFACGISSIVWIINTLINIPLRYSAADLGPFSLIPGAIIGVFVSSFAVATTFRNDNGKPARLPRGVLITLIGYAVIAALVILLSIAFPPQFRLFFR